MSAAEWDWHARRSPVGCWRTPRLDGQRWADLAARLPYLPAVQRDAILARLDPWTPAEFADADRAKRGQRAPQRRA